MLEEAKRITGVRQCIIWYASLTIKENLECKTTYYEDKTINTRLITIIRIIKQKPLQSHILPVCIIIIIITPELGTAYVAIVK